ncbi:MAG: transglycosylase domain-containing protein [Bdellovibrionia bacterium]
MSEKLEAKQILRPVEVYTQGFKVHLHDSLEISVFRDVFKKLSWRERQANEVLLAGDFAVLQSHECELKWKIANLEPQSNCIAWMPNSNSPAPDTGRLHLVIMAPTGDITKLFLDTESVNHLSFPHQLYAQFVGDDPILQEQITLGDISPLCPQAIMAIEDSNFFEHDGYSLKSIGRAFIKNISAGRSRQGGSTITQQLVKNYFLTPEKTIERKLKEFAMAVRLESKFNKDQIIETYMNIIYMGQSGSFQVRGYGAASRFYFNKSAADLELPDCALLAAIINSPGLYNPFKNPERAKQRRDLVLKKMQELQMIDQKMFELSSKKPLPTRAPSLATETAPYFLNSVRKQSENLGLQWQGLKIFTALDLRTQERGQKAIENHLKNLESSGKFKKFKSEGKNLEAVLISINNETGLVHTAIGGRNFRKSQYNRLTSAHRQAGSTIKPFVFLTAFLKDHDPDELILDEKITLKVGSKKWSPENYDKLFHGEVTLTEALKKSYNASTVALAEKVGMPEVLQTLELAGFTSQIPKVPSIYLGSFEVYPIELIQAYLKIANNGNNTSLSFIERIYDDSGLLVFEQQTLQDQVFDPEKVMQLKEILHQATQDGTASAIGRANYPRKALGKTGTTSDYKDAWFVGADELNTTLVWVGYDDNTATGLTGASGAIPIWLEFNLTAFPGKIPSHF